MSFLALLVGGQATILGLGFDASDKYSYASLTKPSVFGFVKVRETSIAKTQIIIDTFKTDSDYLNSFSIDAGVSVSFGLFSAELTSHYSTTTERSENHYWAHKIEKYTNSSDTLEQYYLRSDFVELAEKLSDKPLDTNSSLPASHCTSLKDGPTCDPAQFHQELQDYLQFLSKYGTHYVIQADYGAYFELTSAVDKTSTVTDTDLKVGLEAHYACVTAKVDTEWKTHNAEYVAKSHFVYDMVGGDAGLQNKYAADLLTDDFPASTPQDFQAWQESFHKHSIPLRFQIAPVFTLLNGTRRRNMAFATEVYLASSLWSRIMSSKKSLDQGAGYIGEPNYRMQEDRKGNDYYQFQTQNWQLCRDECLHQYDKCEAWSFSGTTCFLKDEVPPPSQASNAVSGLNTLGLYSAYSRHRENQDRPGASFRDFPSPDYKNCTAACDNDHHHCQMWTWKANHCWLKSDIYPRTATGATPGTSFGQNFFGHTTGAWRDNLEKYLSYKGETEKLISYEQAYRAAIRQI